MRLIGILLVLLVLAYLYKQQLASDPVDSRAEKIGVELNADAPRVPTAPGDVDQFGKDMQEYMNEQAKKRAEAIDEAQEN